MEADEDDDDDEGAARVHAAPPPAQKRGGLGGRPGSSSSYRPNWSPEEDAVLMQELRRYPEVEKAFAAVVLRLPKRSYGGVEKRYELLSSQGRLGVAASAAGEDDEPLALRRYRLLEQSPPMEADVSPPAAPSRPRWCYRAGEQVCGPWKLSAYRKWVAEGAIDAWTSEHVRVWHTEQTEDEAVSLTQALATRRAQQAEKYGWTS